MQPYDILARYYDGGWFEYSEYIAGLIRELEVARGTPFRRVLDAACGTGLLLRFLAEDDSRETRRRLAGFDRSAAMLARAVERVPEGDLRPGDLRGPFPFHGPFDLITCVYDSLNYILDEQELLGFFRAARGCLARDGMLVVDLNDPSLYCDRHGAMQPRLIDGVAIREVLTWDPGPPPMGITTFTFPDGEEEHRQRAWTSDEVEGFLEETGLLLVDSLDVLEEGTDLPSGKVVYVAAAGNGLPPG